ncbi:MAG: GAF domain-containing protein, partial [Anaerolineae bacterium]|nr:GAF domain-containing protein [Anaerolineae bacterium]
MRETTFSRFWKGIAAVFSSPLGRRQIITTFFVVLLPVILLSGVIYVRNRNQAEDNTLDTLNALATAQQTSVTSYIGNLQRTFALAASSAELQESTLVLVESPRSTFFISQVNDILDAYGGPGRSFDSIGVYGLDGQLLAGIGTDNFEDAAEVQQFDTFVSAISGISVSAPFFDPSDGRSELYVAIPVLDELSDTRAVLLGVADLTDLNILLRENLGLGESEDVYLVSREGYFLTDGQDRLVAEQTAPAGSDGIERVLAGESGRSRYLDYNQTEVLGAYRWIPEVQAAVMAEVDAEEALPTPQELIQSVLPVTLISLLVALAVAVFATTTIVRPVVTLTNSAKRIAAGNFDERVPSIGAGEMNTLAQAFNQMSSEIQGLVENLEVRVIERTKDLEATLEVGRITTTLFGQEELLTQTAEFIRERFGLYYVQIYLLDEAKRYAVLRAGTGEAGQMLLNRGHRLNLNETSIVAQTVQLLRPVLVVDTVDSTIHKPNPLLPDTRSEVAIPLLVQNELLGVLDMQSASPGKFNYDNLPAFQAMATQVAGVIRGARALEETQSVVERMNLMNRRLTEAGWQSYMYQLDQQGRLGYQYNLEAPQPLPPTTSLVSGEQVDEDKQIKHPIHVRGQKIGALLIEEDHPREWGEEEMQLIEDVADTVARTLDQMRAFDETQSALNEVAMRAIELQTVAELSTEISSTLEIDTLVKNVSDLVKQRFNLYHAHIYLLDEDGDLLVLAGGAGEAGDQMVAFGHAIPASSEYSLVAQAARSRSAVVVNDITDATAFLPNPLLPQTRSEMALPIMVGNQLLGVLDVQSEAVGRFTEKDMQIQSTLANQIAVAVQNARQFAVTQRQLRDLSIGSQISDLIRQGGEQEALLEKILEKLCEAFDAENAVLSLFSYEENKWYGLAGFGQDMNTEIARTFVDPASRYPHAYQA